MTPILCVGETAEERDAGTTETPARGPARRRAGGARGGRQLASLVVAYEPIWAIGTGRAATRVDAADAASFIRMKVAEAGGPEAGEGVRVQYGGSVNAENAADFLAEPDIDGLLVGGASLQAAGFAEVIRAVGGCYRAPAP